MESTRTGNKKKAKHLSERNGNSSVPAVEKRLRSVRSAGKTKLRHFIQPMLATLHDNIFDSPEWIFEIKWDGYRAIAEVNKDDVKLYSRNGLSFVELYPKVVQALRKVKGDVVLDGEIVVIGKDNKPNFQSLQQYQENGRLPILYYVFDCLRANGKDLTKLPLLERKKILQKLLPQNEVVRYAEHIEGDGKSFFKEAASLNLEGVIAKRASSTYEQGKRTRDWLKIKHHNIQEAIIAGYTAPRGSRTLIGSLVLAIRKNGTLTYIGHTGTGFSNQTLKDLHNKLAPLRRDTSPFREKVPVRAGYVTWVEPELVCNVKFTEITADGILRHPVFQGLRIDKPATEVDHLEKVKKSSRKKATKKD